MAALDKLVTVFFKIILLLVGIAIAVVPTIYLLANEPIHIQGQRKGFDKLQTRIEQVEQIRSHAVSNIYLREGDKSYDWNDIDRTVLLADYICWQLQKKGVVVVRRNLKFKEPKKGKRRSDDDLQFDVSSRIYQTPALSWVKDLLEQHIQFEDQSLQAKQYVIVNFEELSVQTLAQIKQIREDNKKYQFVIISVVPVSAKHTEVASIRSGNATLAAPIPQVNEKEEKNEDEEEKKQVKKQQKVQNNKKDKKTDSKKNKAKNVKEEKEQKPKKVKAVKQPKQKEIKVEAKQEKEEIVNINEAPQQEVIPPILPQNVTQSAFVEL